MANGTTKSMPLSYLVTRISLRSRHLPYDGANVTSRKTSSTSFLHFFGNCAKIMSFSNTFPKSIGKLLDFFARFPISVGKKLLFSHVFQ